MQEADRLHAAIGILSDRVVDLQGEIQGDAEKTKMVVREAVAAGIRDVLCDEQAVHRFWSSFLREVGAHAQREAGGLLFAGIRRAATVTALLLLVYSLGGLTAVVKAWHWITA